MSTQPGLSIFDGAETGGFAVVLRGYDRIQVETHIRKLESALADALNRSSRGEAAAAQVAVLKRELAAAQQRLAEAGNPTYGGLGDHVARLLHTAEGQAHDLVTSARDEAEATVTAAREEAHATVTSARQEAEATITSARSEAAATREAAANAAKRLREETKQATEHERWTAANEAAELLSAAQRAAVEIRGLAEHDAESLRQSSSHEAHTLLEAVQQHVAERRDSVAAEVAARLAAVEAEVANLRGKASEEVEALRTTAVALLNDSRRRAADEVGVLEAALHEVRARIAAMQVPGAPVLRDKPRDGGRDHSQDKPAPRSDAAPGARREGGKDSARESRRLDESGQGAAAPRKGAGSAEDTEPRTPPSAGLDDATQVIPVTRNRVA